jgi:hypothetical protein
MQEDQHRREVERLQVRIADLETANGSLRKQNHALVKKLRSANAGVKSAVGRPGEAASPLKKKKKKKRTDITSSADDSKTTAVHTDDVSSHRKGKSSRSGKTGKSSLSSKSSKSSSREQHEERDLVKADSTSGDSTTSTDAEYVVCHSCELFFFSVSVCTWCE